MASCAFDDELDYRKDSGERAAAAMRQRILAALPDAPAPTCQTCRYARQMMRFDALCCEYNDALNPMFTLWTRPSFGCKFHQPRPLDPA